MKLLTMIQKYHPEVKQVKDSTKSLIIRVEKRDVNSRAVKKHKECAIAVACQRTAGFDGAIIGRSKAFLIKGDVAIRFDVTGSAAREIVSFDRGGTFEPGEYQLSRPATKLGYHSRAGTKNDKNRSKPKRFKHVTENIRESLNPFGD